MVEETENLESLLDRLSIVPDEDGKVRLRALLRAAGRQSFGPMLLVPGLIAFSPLSGIPGVPTLIGSMVLLITGQLLIGRKCFWLPRFVLNLGFSRGRFIETMRLMRKLGVIIDQVIKPRYVFLTRNIFVYLIAVVCLLLSLIAPVLEVLPFSATAVGLILCLFGIALIAEDGVLVVIALVICAAVGSAVTLLAV